MKREIKCDICGKMFFSDASRSPKYCSLACKDIGRYQHTKAWHERNENYMRDYMRKFRSKSPLNE